LRHLPASDAVASRGLVQTLPLPLLPAAAVPSGPPVPREPAAVPAAVASLGEDELTRGALAGDNSCWSALIARHSHKVVVALLAQGIALEQAKELAQETWLRLLQQQRAARLTELKLPGLAIVQARFLAASARRRGAPTIAEPSAAGADPLALADEQLIGQQQLQRVAVALQSCPPSLRRVFQLVYENPELTYAEVAERLGLSTQRVKQIVCEVRKQLRAVLEDAEP
jgi:RNA polymerase sigma-70 factor (ECF subfamily)